MIYAIPDNEGWMYSWGPVLKCTAELFSPSLTWYSCQDRPEKYESICTSDSPYMEIPTTVLINLLRFGLS